MCETSNFLQVGLYNASKITNELLFRHLILLMVITIVHPVTLQGLKSILFRNMFSYIYFFFFSFAKHC